MVPRSWRSFYKYNPCVPVDFSTVKKALSVVRGTQGEGSQTVRILLRPGHYVLDEAITVQAPGLIRVEVETMQMPASFAPIHQTDAVVESVPVRKQKSSPFRRLMTCRSIDAIDQDDEEDEDDQIEIFDPSMLRPPQTSLAEFGRQRATLALRTRRANEPIIRVRQGCAILRNLALHHVSHGLGKLGCSFHVEGSQSSTVLLAHILAPLQIFGTEMPQFRSSRPTGKTIDQSSLSPRLKSSWNTLKSLRRLVVV